MPLLLRAGRHPLTEMLVDRFIPNDTHMGAESGRVQVVTGKLWPRWMAGAWPGQHYLLLLLVPGKQWLTGKSVTIRGLA